MTGLERLADRIDRLGDRARVLLERRLRAETRRLEAQLEHRLLMRRLGVRSPSF